MSPQNRVPKYCHHKASGNGYVTLDGRIIYLGTYRSAASRAEYDRVIAEWMAAGRRLPIDQSAITIAEVVSAFRKHAATYYGLNSRTAGNIDEALKPVVRLYGRTPAVEFGPLRLKAVRQTMIDAGRVRQNINRNIVRIRGVFRWAAENELIPAGVHHGLMALSGLSFGRSGAVEGEAVKPVPVEFIKAVLPHVSPQVAAMIQLQLLTAMRPGEACIMRGADIDTTGSLWMYQPSQHKTKHRGQDRTVYLGPKAQEIVRPFLKADLSAYLFSPIDADVWRRQRAHERRKTPLSCGNKPGSNRKGRPQRKPGEHYDTGSYYVAIKRACDAADQWAKGGRAVDNVERVVPRWHPHQIRHTAATELRKQHGLEAAQVILGHKTLTVTQVYAEKNVEAARSVMALVG